MRETVYIVTTDNRPVQDWLLDRMGWWNPAEYRAGVEADGLRAVALDDWHSCWTQGDDVFHSHEAAKVDVDLRAGVHHVLTLHLEDVEEAIRRLVA